MIRALRIKIIAVISLLLTIVVIGIMVAINVVSRSNNETQIHSRLYDLALHDGKMSYTQDSDTESESDNGYLDNFSVMIDGANRLLGIRVRSDDPKDEDEMLSYANEALFSRSESGEVGNYAFLIQKKHYGRIISFIDTTPYKEASHGLFAATILIGGIAIGVFFILSVGLAFWLVRPVKETFDKQKLFISNASHELKTPLAVISANTEVLEAEIGENKWLGYIRSEAVRMNELVNELLILARLDDKTGHKLIMSELNLSDLVMYTVLPFESTAFESGKKLETDVQPDIMYVGDESSLKHIITILMDNALKYSAADGEISVKLYMKGNRRYLEVYNTGEGIRQDKLNKVFERFYREDEARNSKSGGYGLGLAIARTSAEAHGGRIYAQSEYGKWVKFVVVL